MALVYYFFAPLKLNSGDWVRDYFKTLFSRNKYTGRDHSVFMYVLQVKCYAYCLLRIIIFNFAYTL